VFRDIRQLTRSLHRRSYEGFPYQSEMARGVDIGGWFVLEPYITPSLFEQFQTNGQSIPVDEYHFCQQLGKEECQNQLNQHWSTWITEEDFENIASFGLNHVRIPIGYWAFQPLADDPYVQGQRQYLNQALGWAQKYNLSVWIDLHGAPGSQNGFDNSGLRDTLDWQTNDYVNITLNVLQEIAKLYGQENYNGVVVAIELVNEPLGPSLNMDEIKQFYENGWQTIRDTGSDTGVVIHDAFQAYGYWNDFMALPDYFNVILDHHNYQVFSAGQLQQTIQQHVDSACTLGWETRNETLWRIVGEWSGALTDCSLWLNGVGRGARYSGDYDNSPYIGSCNGRDNITTWSEQDKQNVRRFVEAQMDAYEQGNGWIFWCWKTESTVEWDMQVLAANGLFPQPLSDRQYPNQCNFD
jgi:glucan 1,3-beta-glucosidase